MWTKEKVLQLIQERTAERLPLSYSVVVRDAEALAGAARRLFGSWGTAIEAAGLDYQKIKKQARSSERLPVGYWNTQRIIEILKTREASGSSLNPHAVQNEDSKLYAAAAQYFGSWGKAMEAAGIDYLEHRKTRGWDAETIIRQIKTAHARGAELSDTTVQTFAGGLYGGAITHFGSWRAAVEAAGLEYGTIRRSQQWSKEEIHNAVQCAVTDGQRLVRTSFPPNFYPAVLDHFGSWEKLLEESGYGEKPWGKIDRSLQNHIREFRKKAGLSQTELGKRIGVSHRTISLLELSQQIDPRVSFATRLAKELGCNVSDLFSHLEH